MTIIRGPQVQLHPVTPGSVIQDPGIGGIISDGIAGVLAAMQQAKENQYRQEQLRQAAAQQAMMAQYYQGQLSIQSRQEDRADAEARQKAGAAGQVGEAIRRWLMPSQAGVPAAPQRRIGNTTQAGGGLLTQTGLVAPQIPSQPNLPPGIQGPVPSATTDPAGAGVFQELLAGAAGELEPSMRAVFEGVAPENIPALVQQLQEVQALQPKSVEGTTDQKDFEYYNRLARVDPQRAALFKTFFLDPKPGTQITNIAGQGETEFTKKWAEAQVKVLSEGQTQAKGTIQMFPALDEAYRLVGKSFTGFGANQLLNLARVARAAGAVLPDDWKPTGPKEKDRIADTQTLLKLTREQTLNYLRSRDLGSGTAVSDGDRLFMERQSGADISLDPNTIRRTIRINVGSSLMKAQEAVNDLRDQAVFYPANAAQLNKQAEQLEMKLMPVRRRYYEMLQAEGMGAENIRRRASSLPGFKPRTR